MGVLKEKYLNNKNVIYPMCNFCGNSSLPGRNYSTQEEANEEQTKNCNCPKARDYQNELKRKEDRKKNIQKLEQSINDFKNYCERRDSTLTDNICDFIKDAGIKVLDDVISSFSIRFSKIKVNVSKNNKENIVIGFTYSDGAKVEV